MAQPTSPLKAIMPKGLLGRSLLIIFLPLLLVQVISVFVFYDNHWDNVSKRLSNAVAGEVGFMVEHLNTFPAPEQQAWLLDTAQRRMNVRAEFWPDAILPNEPLPTPRASLHAQLLESLDRRVGKPVLVEESQPGEEIAVYIQMSDGVLHARVLEKRLFSSTTYIFILWSAGSSLILLSIAAVFMRNQVRSVRKLAAAADAFGKGRAVMENFKPEGATEVRQAGAAFNLMQERIRRQIDQRTEMLAGVSHDLRTPLTRMKLELALLGEDEKTADLREDVAEMERMLEGYLAFARGEGTETVQATDITDLIEDVAGRFRREGAMIDVHCESDIIVPLRKLAFERCISNLIANAVRYAGHVWVRAGRRGEHADVTVEDDGPGIPEDKREDVFKAFQRLEGSRNPKTGGTGLGLTIARDVVRVHGGEIRLEDSPLGGLRVRVRLPL